MMGWFGKTLRCYKYIFLYNLVFALCVSVGLVHLGVTLHNYLAFISTLSFFAFYIGFIPLSLFFGFLVKVYFQYRKARKDGVAFKTQWRGILNDPFLVQITDGFIAYLVMMMLVVVFCAGKSLVNGLGVYSWDPLFASMDKILHGGHYPQEYLAPMMHSCFWLMTWEYIYEFYFFLLTVGMAYVLFFEKDRHLRKTVMWAQCLCWSISGVVIATLLASVGPIFYNDFYAPNEVYGRLLNGTVLHLGETCGARINLVRAVLLAWSTDNDVLSSNVISAMPSMHISILMIGVLYLWQKNIIARVAGVTFLGLSITAVTYFGFHYTIDAYVSIILTILLWNVSKRLAAKTGHEAAGGLEVSAQAI